VKKKYETFMLPVDKNQARGKEEKESRPGKMLFFYLWYKLALIMISVLVAMMSSTPSFVVFYM
jgi:hypothetical protein